jgi:hypothetical protein
LRAAERRAGKVVAAGAGARTYLCATIQMTGWFPDKGLGETVMVVDSGFVSAVFVRSRFADGTPVRAKDFSQS